MFSRVRSYFKGSHLARMSDGTHCVIRDLGLVKGGKGMRHHEVLMTFSIKALSKRIRQRGLLSVQSLARRTGSPESQRMIGADAINELPATKS
jgi:hypothetical protein